MLKGEVGWEITLETIMPYVEAGKDIVLDTYGGDLWEALSIYDALIIRSKMILTR